MCTTSCTGCTLFSGSGSSGSLGMALPADSPGRRSGSLQFSALATTRAMCPHGSLAPALGRALPFVRSYLLEGGQLHLSLMADGGILTWAPAP